MFIILSSTLILSVRAGQEQQLIESNSRQRYYSSGYSMIKCNLLDYFQFDIDSTFVIEDQKNFCLVFLKQLIGDSEIALLRVASC